MVYRRRPPFMRYYHNANVAGIEKTPALNSKEVVEDIIPMPNEAENTEYPNDVSRSIPSKHQPSIISSFRNFLKNIGTEEIMIIALIILLLNEGLRDEFLILILIYILIT